MVEAGKTYGRLTALYRVKNRGNSPYWAFSCGCGKSVHITKARPVELGLVKGCGCVKHVTRSALKHGGKGTKLYKIWKGMRKRCRKHPRYVERGIRVCAAWDDFATFRDWAYNCGYNDSLEIDRIDNDGNYSPGNCRWATRTEQMRNTSRTRMVEFRGQIVPARALADIACIKRETFLSRLNYGWDIERAMFTPVKRYRHAEVADS